MLECSLPTEHSVPQLHCMNPRLVLAHNSVIHLFQFQRAQRHGTLQARQTMQTLGFCHRGFVALPAAVHQIEPDGGHPIITVFRGQELVYFFGEKLPAPPLWPSLLATTSGFRTRAAGPSDQLA